ncbi:hypothetical protein POM88_013222 [Heracleum sosnowskyi]|uniref:BED-type domain-containing protein n=1 Tax=Heracleum sosnowskyi TaxID=360622 RepID=A0AAD8J0K8_9APIA|nr:hypothetical protein POM88_013222 [Heracleum sosnowskyi]
MCYRAKLIIHPVQYNSFTIEIGQSIKKSKLSNCELTIQTVTREATREATRELVAMDDGVGQISKQGEGISEKEAVDLNPQVINVNLEDEEVKCDEKLDENCEKGKKGLVVWNYFNRISGLPVGKEKAKCSLCNVIIGCYSRNGTSAMMNHLKTVCPKSPLRNNIDKLQKTLRFEII